MAAFDAVTELPPPSRHWDDPDSEQLLLPAPEIALRFEWLPGATTAHLSSLSLQTPPAHNDPRQQSQQALSVPTQPNGSFPQPSDSRDASGLIPSATTAPGNPAVSHETPISLSLLVVGASKRWARLLRALAAEDASPFVHAATVHCQHVADEHQLGGRSLPSSSLFLAPCSPLPVGLLAVGAPSPPAENCPQWAQQALRQLQPNSALLLADVPPRTVMGPPMGSGDLEGGSDEPPVLWKLETDTAQDTTREWTLPAIPPFPSGGLVQALPAAIITHFQLRSLPAALLVGLEQPFAADDRPTTQAVAAVLSRALQAHGVAVGEAVQRAEGKNWEEGQREASVSPLNDLYA